MSEKINSIFITGASSGFGEACARLYAQKGSRLILVARSGNKLQKLETELKNKCPVHTITLDVGDRNKVNKSISQLPDEFSSIDVLINNAGLALGMESVDKASMDDWETMIDTNIKGLLYITKAVLPGMVAQNKGHIINIGSIAGSWPYPGGNVYGASKAFVQQFSRNMRADLLGKNIRVTNLEPGIADTNFSNIRLKGDKSKAQAVYENTKPLIARDIAEIIYWISSIPQHVNVNSLEVMPVCQAWGPFSIDRNM